MKGKILGFDGTSGAINADDQKRYAFKLADWKGDHPPAAKMRVDFVGDGAAARDIYPAEAGFEAAMSQLDIAALKNSPHVERAKSTLKSGLEAPLALLILFACILPYMNMPRIGGSLITIGSAIDRMPVLAEAASSGVSQLFFLRFLAPIGAIWVLYAAFSGKPLRLPALFAGVGCLIALILPYLLKSALVSAAGAFFGSAVSALISVGFGAWLIGLCGIAIILAAMSKIKSPLSKS